MAVPIVIPLLCFLNTDTDFLVISKEKLKMEAIPSDQLTVYYSSVSGNMIVIN